MRKGIPCKECNEICKVQIVCDTCSKELEYDAYILDNGYGSHLDGAKYDFCSLTCLHDFTFEELVKEQREKA